MKPSDAIYALATGPRVWRRILTLVGGLLFFALLAVVILGGRFSDRALSLPRLLPGAVGAAVGAALLGAGLVLWAWCVRLFWRAHGTPVPANPPRELVSVGPYAWVRNPMLTGVFACLFGLGFVLHSVSIVFIFAPAFVLLNAIELKLVEEPELERRLGAPYRQYRLDVPMFFPRVGRRVAAPPGDQRER